MKTIEEKAKAYDESLERAKEQLNGAKVFDYDNEQIAHDIRTTVYNIFPELKESEDEKIRKALISAINNICAGDEGLVTFNGFSKEQVLAWLEKQGKHANFRNKIQIGDKVTRNDNGELVNLSQLERVAKKLEKQEEQKPVEEYNITGIGSKNAQGKLGEMIKNLNPVNEILEQKPAWSEEDKDNIVLIQMAIYSLVNDGITSTDATRLCEWLKSLKERVQPQPEQEWSEEDEKRLKSCLNVLQAKGIMGVTDTINTKWLKSLKERVDNFDGGYKVGFSAAKHNQWKPSEEQMERLNGIINSLPHQEVLYSLYQDLKKLREE